MLSCFHIGVSPEGVKMRFILNMSTQTVSTISKEARTYCDQLVERLGIGIWTQVAVDVWAHEGREGDRAVTEQGAAGLQGWETGAGGLKMRKSPRQTPQPSTLQPEGTSRSSAPPGAFLWGAWLAPPHLINI